MTAYYFLLLASLLIVGITLILFVLSVLIRFASFNYGYSKSVNISSWAVIIEGIIILGMFLFYDASQSDYFFILITMGIAVLANYLNKKFV